MTPSQALIYYATRCVCLTSERATFNDRGGAASHHDPACQPCMYAIADPEIRALLDGADDGCHLNASRLDIYVDRQGRHTMDLAEQTCIATSTIGRRVKSGFYSERQRNDAAVATIGEPDPEPEPEDDEPRENDGMSGACLCHDSTNCPDDVDARFGEGPDY